MALGIEAEKTFDAVMAAITLGDEVWIDVRWPDRLCRMAETSFAEEMKRHQLSWTPAIGGSPRIHGTSD